MPNSPRRCAPCTACCDYPAIPELNKPTYSPCQHATPTGCGIYADRPKPCRDYACLWIEGEFDEDDRPDKIGLAFDHPSSVTGHPDYAGLEVICARELWPGSSEGARACDLLLRLSRAMLVRLVAHGGRAKILGPRAMIEQLSAQADRRKAAGG